MKIGGTQCMVVADITARTVYATVLCFELARQPFDELNNSLKDRTR